MSDLPWDTDVVDDQPELPVERRQGPMPSTIVFEAPDRGRAQRQADFLAAHHDSGFEDWEVGEPRFFYRVTHRVGRGWCVVRTVRG